MAAAAAAAAVTPATAAAAPALAPISSRHSSSFRPLRAPRGGSSLAPRQTLRQRLQRAPLAPAAAGSGANGGAAGAPDANALAGLFMAYAQQVQQQMAAAQAAAAAAQDNLRGANVLARGLEFHPPGAEAPLLSGVGFHLRSNQLGLVIGRSGSGKTTLLQVLAGLSEQTAGDVFVSRDPLPRELLLSAAAEGGDGSGGTTTTSSSSSNGNGASSSSSGSSGAAASASPPSLAPAHVEARMRSVGLVFQFPERHFLGGDVLEDLTFAWPRDFQHWGERQALAARLQAVMEAVGLTDIPLDIPPSALSGGQQRRLALAVQLVRAPSLLLLDEPLSGLDWRARAEVVELLAKVKERCTLLVVSHDLREIAPLVDAAWRMRGGGRMGPVAWPPRSLGSLEEEGRESGGDDEAAAAAAPSSAGQVFL